MQLTLPRRYSLHSVSVFLIFPNADALRVKIGSRYFGLTSRAGNTAVEVDYGVFMTMLLPVLQKIRRLLTAVRSKSQTYANISVGTAVTRSESRPELQCRAIQQRDASLATT